MTHLQDGTFLLLLSGHTTAVMGYPDGVAGFLCCKTTILDAVIEECNQNIQYVFLLNADCYYKLLL